MPSDSCVQIEQRSILVTDWIQVLGGYLSIGWLLLECSNDNSVFEWRDNVWVRAAYTFACLYKTLSST